MTRLQMLVTIACAALLASGFAMGGEIYKWVDENGNVHYEDRPVGEGEIERVVDIRSRNTDNAVVAARVYEQRRARAAARQFICSGRTHDPATGNRTFQILRHGSRHRFIAPLRIFANGAKFRQCQNRTNCSLAKRR